MGSEWVEVIWGVADDYLPERIPEGYETWQAWFATFRDREVAQQFQRREGKTMSLEGKPGRWEVTEVYAGTTYTAEEMVAIRHRHTSWRDDVDV